MSQISFTDLVNGTVPDASDFNSRLNALKNRINNGVEADNVADNAITTAKINNNAVTGAKIAMGSDAAGDALYFNGTDYARLALGTAGQLLQVNTGATAPEWVTYNPGAVVQVVNVSDSTMVENLSAIPKDSTTPQITEGTEVMSLAITPTLATSKLRVDVVCQLGGATAGGISAAVFNTDVHATNAQASASTSMRTGGDLCNLTFTYWLTASDANGTSATTFTVRAGNAVTDADFNGSNGATIIGNPTSSITITEIRA